MSTTPRTDSQWSAAKDAAHKSFGMDDAASFWLAVATDMRDFSRKTEEELTALRAQLETVRKERDGTMRELEDCKHDFRIIEHKLVCCGVLAQHADTERLKQSPYESGGKWDSPQAEAVRKLRAQLAEAQRERDQWRGVATRLAELLRKAQLGHDYGSARANAALADFDRMNKP